MTGNPFPVAGSPLSSAKASTALMSWPATSVSLQSGMTYVHSLFMIQSSLQSSRPKLIPIAAIIESLISSVSSAKTTNPWSIKVRMCINCFAGLMLTVEYQMSSPCSAAALRNITASSTQSSGSALRIFTFVAMAASPIFLLLSDERRNVATTQLEWFNEPCVL